MKAVICMYDLKIQLLSYLYKYDGKSELHEAGTS